MGEKVFTVSTNHSRVQSQVSGVISIMKENISKVMDRGEKLESLEEKSGVWGGRRRN